MNYRLERRNQRRLQRAKEAGWLRIDFKLLSSPDKGEIAFIGASQEAIQQITVTNRAVVPIRYIGVADTRDESIKYAEERASWRFEEQFELSSEFLYRTHEASLSHTPKDPHNSPHRISVEAWISPMEGGTMTSGADAVHRVNCG